jgi:membrane protein implicated in regulation of membrane protease activity
MLYYFEFLGLFGFWFCAGAVLLSIELLLGGSAFFLTLACAAFVTSVAAGLHDGMTWAASFAVFAVLLIPAVVAWRWYINRLHPPIDSARRIGTGWIAPSLKEGITDSVLPAMPGVK